MQGVTSTRTKMQHVEVNKQKKAAEKDMASTRQAANKGTSEEQPSHCGRAILSQMRASLPFIGNTSSEI